MAMDTFKQKKLIHEWEKTDRGDKIRVNVAGTNTRKYLDIRTWYTDPQDGVLKPGKGISIPIEDDNMEELIKAMELVSEQWNNGELLEC